MSLVMPGLVDNDVGVEFCLWLGGVEQNAENYCESCRTWCTGVEVFLCLIAPNRVVLGKV